MEDGTLIAVPDRVRTVFLAWLLLAAALLGLGSLLTVSHPESVSAESGTVRAQAR